MGNIQKTLLVALIFVFAFVFVFIFAAFPQHPRLNLQTRQMLRFQLMGKQRKREREREGKRGRGREREGEKNRIKLKCKTISASHLVPSKSKLFSCQRHARVNMRSPPPPLPPSLPSSPSAQRELALLIPVFCDQHWILKTLTVKNVCTTANWLTAQYPVMAACQREYKFLINIITAKKMKGGMEGGVVKPNTACTFRFSVAFSPHKMSQSIKKTYRFEY